jgi:TolB-like protein/cytochrome c-type biogenesis protein CcmH/NrfG
MSAGSFFAELRRRKVVQAAAIYGAVAWGVTEVVVTVVEQLFLPQWVSTLAVIGFVVGFPVAMFLAWTFDITAEGIERTAISSRRGKASIAASVALLLAGTAGLFFLIKPSIQFRETVNTVIEVPPNSLAVLPFENAGLDSDDAYLSEGLSDALRDQLGQVSDLRIAARSSSIAAREQRLDALTTSSKLRVAHLVEGSLRRQGNKLRISVQLIEGNSGLAIWSETFERGPNELLNIQEAIAQQIVRKVLPDAQTVVSEPATRDVTANELMLLARYYDQKVRDRQEVDVPTLLEAVRLYREAVEADPESALAHSRLAGALLYLGDVDAAEAPIFKALSLSPNLSEVQNTLGEFYWARGLPEAGTAFARAVELNPNDADALHNYASWLLLAYDTRGITVEELNQFYRRALELDPLSLSRYAALGDFLGKFSRYDEIPAVIQDTQELFHDAEAYRLIGWLQELSGELDRAIAWTIRARNMEPGNSDHLGKLAELYASIGDFETALLLEPEPGLGLLFQMRRYRDLIDIAEFLMIEEPGDVDVRYLLAFAYNATGQFESAIHVLSTTGLPDLVLNDMARSVSDIEGFHTLINALAGAGQPETTGLANSLALWSADGPWWGDVGWTGLFRGCSLAILGRDEEALQRLSMIKESPRLRRAPFIQDSWCFQKYVNEPIYQDILHDQEERRTALRERLPATLAEFGVEL